DRRDDHPAVEDAQTPHFAIVTGHSSERLTIKLSIRRIARSQKTARATPSGDQGARALSVISRLTGGDPQIGRCIAGSFLLRAAAAGATALISFFIADLERSGSHVRGSMVIGLATALFFGAEIVGAIGFGA